MKNAIVLCSGGIDSVTTAYYVKKSLKYDDLVFLFFDYNQKTAKYEERFSRFHARKLNADFEKIKLPYLGRLSTSLIHKKGSRETKREELKKLSGKQTADWYVPYRNTIFLSYALALADSLYIRENKKYDIFTGFICEGSGNFPDTTFDYVKEINKLGKFGMAKFEVRSPLIKLDKDEVIKLGLKLGIDYTKTISCFVALNCGVCLNCRLRQEAFYWANFRDKTKYKKKLKDFRLV